VLILPTTRGIIRNVTNVLSASASVAWNTTFGSTITLSAPNATFTASAANANGFGTFTNVLPASGQYYIDVTLPTGQDNGSVDFLGISNEVSALDYPQNTKYKAWYWSGGWFGIATDDGTTGPALVSGTYRIAIDRTNSHFYMQKISGTPSVVRNAALPSGSNMFLMVLSQSGFTTGGASILNGGTIAGHGGLY